MVNPKQQPVSMGDPNQQTTSKLSLESNQQFTYIRPSGDANMSSTLTNQLTSTHYCMMTALSNMLSGLSLQNQPPQYYELKIKSITNHWDKIQFTHNKLLLDMTNNSLIDYNLQEYFDLEEQVHQLLAQLYERARQSSSQSTLISNNQNTSNEANMTSTMKLPKVELPKFDGDYLKWRQFRDLFTELIHKQPIAACQKMWYLKGSLSGEPEKMIRHLITSEDNYNIAWQTINDRYENIRLLVTASLNKLLSQPNLVNESAATIKALHDTTNECLLSLKNLDVDVDHWDPILLHILIKKLDRQTHTLWEQSLDHPKSLQSMADFLKFLETRFQSLEALGPQRISSKGVTQKALTTTATTNCPYCSTNHSLYACPKFLLLSPSKRLLFVKRSKLCINCLKTGHNLANCQSRTCTKCNKKHNTLLHLQASTFNPTSTPSHAATTSSNQSTRETTHQQQKTSLSINAQGHVLLSTALVKLSAGNKTIECRAILDSGSQLNLVTKRIVKKLGLKTRTGLMNIEGIGASKQRSEGRINVLLESRINGFNTRLEAYILPHIISKQPAETFDITAWTLPANIPLADPNFNVSEKIDLLIGAELYYSLLSVGQIKLNQDLPTLQNTVFGWVVSGRVNALQNTQLTCGICTEFDELSQNIERFWSLEEPISKSKQLTSAEQRCETHFIQNTYRNDDGRFVVKLPFNEDASKLGESKEIALQRFFAIERKLAKNIDIKAEYIKFMDEYLRLGHMEEIDFNTIQKPYYFLPHHCVLKPDSTTTKLRVVFDASSKTSTNWSLNDILATGPTIQDDVFSILLRFRFPRYVFTADIEKMYRQIQVHPSDQKYQLIWWRKDMNEKLRCYKLKTVTYGTTCAPYLATKCLETLAEESIAMYPLGAAALKNDFYVDDVLTGADTLTEAKEIQRQLQLMLQSAGLNLRKWCANHPQLLSMIPHEHQEIQLNFDSKTEDQIKAVGLIWLPKSDELSIKASWCNTDNITKRTILSDIARFFDPLGILMPVTVLAKMFLQKLWSYKCDWDAALPQEMYTYWAHFREQLKNLNNIKFPRHITKHKQSMSIQIHIFADASEKAYGAVAYVRSIHTDNTISVQLLCSKTRVAPLKKVTLPRLELCAAKMAAELAQRLQHDLKLTNTRIHLWSDSEIVLAWINSTSSNYQTFVANRISTIQQLTIPQQWRHVRSKDNPADVLSRGITPDKLKQCHIWFYGPKFLHGVESIWPQPYIKNNANTDIEKRGKVTLIGTGDKSTDLFDNLTPTNSFRKVQRIFAYIIRFRNGTIRTIKPPKNLVLTSEELDEALVVIVRLMQLQQLREEYVSLERTGEIPRNSSISNLTPFLDDKGVMRVGGRLENSALSYQAKHPMILPYEHHLTKSFLNDIHKEHLHVGPQTLLAIARQTVWPIKGKILARSVVHHCVQCAKTKPKLLTQLMGNLPKDRVQPSRPFVNSGVDFCGPIWTHFKIRGKKPQKSYIAVFCCFATKATHLEIVTDLTTQGFLAALRRFIARRGHCKTIYCDNATNFVGTRNLLEAKGMIESQASQEQIMTACSSKGIDFHFIPPRSPHFGGLWEAAVKSAKHLLQRILASAALTYEELETAVVEVEAILNSRPITPMSTDPNDLTALTPGHFLIGEPLTSTIDSAAQPNNIDLNTRWKVVSHIKNEFWSRWSTEYLNQLQHRYRWKQKCDNVKLNTLVLIKEDNVPPLKWPMGRIINTIQGNDGLVRVVDIKTASGIIRRPIHKLAPLPIETESEVDHTSITPLKDNYVSSPQPSTSKNSTLKREQRLNDNSEPTKRKRHNMLGATLLSLLICMVLPISRAAPIQLTSWKHQPGIYFENLGTANIITNEWNLIIYYDMKSYWEEFAFLRNSTKLLIELCSKMPEPRSCGEIINHLHNLQDEILRNNLLLELDVPSLRKRRGAINFVGNVANALFGVLDEEYAEKMSQTIENIHENEEYHLALIKNQTTIMDATLNVMKKSEESLAQQFNYINAQIDKINTEINNELHLQSIFQTFDSISLLAILTTSKFLRIQSAILNVLTDTHNGRINPLLISPQQLKEEVIRIKSHLTPSLRMPVSLQDLHILYTLATIEGKMTSQHVIFKLKIPLISSEDFELLKITPIPFRHNDTSYVIKPSSPFLVVNLHRDQYYPLTDQELQSCIVIKQSRHLCKQKHPIYRKGSTVSKCEVDLINNLPNSSACDVSPAINGPHWIQLYTFNQWIYSLLEKTVLNVVCEEITSQYTISGLGILTINNKCIIKQPLITIQSHNIYPTNTKASYFPSTNISEVVRIPGMAANTNETIHHYSSYVNEIEIIKRQLAQYKDNINPKFDQHDIHHYAVGYTSLLLVIALTVITLFWKFCYKRTPIPKPRTRTTPIRRPSILQFDTSFDV